MLPRLTLEPRIVTQDTAERIGLGLDLVPPGIRQLVGEIPFFEGNVVHAGLLDGGTLRFNRDDGGVDEVPVEECARCFWRVRGREVRPSLIALPSKYCGRPNRWPDILTVLHEYGHAVWNHVIRQHEGQRVYWDVGAGRVAVRESTSGLMPSMISVSGYHGSGDDGPSMVEQFAEAFAYWLAPHEHSVRDHTQRDHVEQRIGRYPAERLYYAKPRLPRDHWGVRFDNRHLLAFFNELAGLPGDTPPVALR